MMVIISVILLNVLWFACVLGASNGLLWPSLASLVVLLVVVFANTGFYKKDLYVIGFSLFIGILIDGLLQGSGLLVYASPFHEYSLLPPIWIMILWVGFAASIKTGMQWFLRHPKLGVIVMTLGAPMSYYSASRLGAVEISSMLTALMAIALGWLIYFLCITQLFYPNGGRNDVLA
ncbi:DUF2878 family protein [Marinicella litoralis]